MNKMSRDELIQLIKLLVKYEDDLKHEIYNMGSINTKEKFATKVFIQNHLKLIDELKDAISFDIYKED